MPARYVGGRARRYSQLFRRKKPPPKIFDYCARRLADRLAVAVALESRDMCGAAVLREAQVPMVNSGPMESTRKSVSVIFWKVASTPSPKMRPKCSMSPPPYMTAVPL